MAEAGLAAVDTVATKFVTYADYWTGVAYVNDFANSNSITFTARDMNGTIVGTKTISILGAKHGAENVGPMLGLCASLSTQKYRL